MKTKLKIILMAAIIAIGQTFTLPALAEEEGDPTGAYIGIGAAFANLDCPTTSALRCTSNTDTAPYIYLGGMFNEHVGLELGYFEAEFGLARGRDTGTLEFSSLQLALIGRLPFNDNVAAFGKLGAASNSASVSGNIGSVFTADSGVMFGLGLEVQSGDFAGRLEYNQVDADLGYGGLSILYRFR